nr:retrovirus-related Pol polyprotein from transposon TNT 1-94 [Tanacetum cinerariifolium]
MSRLVRHVHGGTLRSHRYKWKPKTSTLNVKPNVSMPLGIKSRTTTISEPTTLWKSTISNTPSSFNSFAARRDNFIHHRLWVFKALDRKSQASKGLQAQVRTVQTDKGTKFLNKTLHAYFAQEGIEHQTFVARTPEQNGVVRRWNSTLVEAAQTMLSATKVPLYFWAEAIATACFTQFHSLIIPRQEETPYHIIIDGKPSVKFFYIFGSLCYIVRDGENLYKMKEKELLNLCQSLSCCTTVDAPNQCQQQQHTTPSTSTTVTTDTPILNIQTTTKTISQAPTQAPTVIANENIMQAETNKEHAQVDKDEFINIFSIPVQE